MQGLVEPEGLQPQRGPQSHFLASRAEIAIYGGAAGAGKSYALLLQALQHVDVPGFEAVIFRRTFPELKAPGGLWKESRRLFSKVGGKANVHQLEWQFPSTAIVKFSHLQLEDDIYAWQGAQAAMIAFDEASLFTEQQFWYLLSRNRSMCGIKPYFRMTTNPDPDSFVAKLIEWWLDDEGDPIPERSGVVRYFIRGADGNLIWDAHKGVLQKQYPNQMPKSLTFIPGKIYDNKILMRKDPGYVANLQALDVVQRSRLLLGNWKIRYSSGLLFNAREFKRANPGDLPGGLKLVRYWDRAATLDGGDFTVGVLMGEADGKYCILNVERGQWGPADRDNIILRTAIQDGVSTAVYFEQEPGSSGKDSADALIKKLVGFNVRADKVTGHKIDRAQPLAAQVHAGNVYFLSNKWNDAFLRELNDFPTAKHDDQVDAASGAFNALAKVARALVTNYSLHASAKPQPLTRSLMR